MNIEVKISSAVTNKEELEIKVKLQSGSSITDLLAHLCSADEQLRHSFFERSGKLKSDILILKNGHHAGLSVGLSSELVDGDTIAVFPLLAGG